MELFSSGESTSDAMSEVHRALLVYFVKAIKPTAFRAHFNIGRLHVEQFLK